MDIVNFGNFLIDNEDSEDEVVKKATTPTDDPALSSTTPYCDSAF